MPSDRPPRPTAARRQTSRPQGAGPHAGAAPGGQGSAIASRGRPAPTTEAERRAADVRARRGPRPEKDPDAERRAIEERTLDEWIDEGSVRKRGAGRVPPRVATGPGRSRDRRRPVDAGTAATIDGAVGAQRGARLRERLAVAAEALERNRLDEAQRTIKPLVDELPQVAAVRRISGLTAYRLGRWRRAVDDLQAARPSIRLSTTCPCWPTPTGR